MTYEFPQNPTFSILPHKPQFLCLDDFIANCKIPLAELIEKEAQPVHDIWVNLEPKVSLRWSEFNYFERSFFIFISHLPFVTCHTNYHTHDTQNHHDHHNHYHHYHQHH